MVEVRLTEQERERFVRQLVLEDWGEEAQAALWDASALVVGLGVLLSFRERGKGGDGHDA